MLTNSSTTDAGGSSRRSPTSATTTATTSIIDEHCKGKCLRMKKEEFTFRFSEEQLRWLDEMTKHFDLSSRGKAVRCCCNYAAQVHKTLPKKTEAPTTLKASTVQILLATSQAEWLREEVRKNEGDLESTVYLMLGCCIEAEADIVFGKIRCKSNTTTANSSKPTTKSAETEDTDDGGPVRLLVIQKGFGGGKHGARWAILTTAANEEGNSLFDLSMPDIPEPCFREKGLVILRDAIRRFRPHMLVCGSRGGKYVASLLTEGTWNGPVFGFSSLDTSTICSANKGTVPVMLCHGTQDSTNQIRNVRKDALVSETCELVEFDDVHHLEKLNATFVSLLMKLYRRFVSASSRKLWKDQRARWLKTYLGPRIMKDDKISSEALEAAKKARRARGGLLAALSKRK